MSSLKGMLNSRWENFIYVNCFLFSQKQHNNNYHTYESY